MFTNTELLRETPRLGKFACKLTTRYDDAEDLLQAAILKALEKKHQFEAGTNLFSWISKIMFNMFVADYRHQMRFDTRYDPDWYIEHEAVNPAPEAAADLATVSRAMESLSDDHREILILVCINGMQYAEVAEMLNIQIGTVRSRLSRARENLLAALRHRQEKFFLSSASTAAVPVTAQA